MVKRLGLALALLLTFVVSASAADLAGKVQSVNPSDQSFVLEDGTRLWLPAGVAADVMPGEKVLATYEMQGDKKVVIGLDRRTTGTEGQETTNFGMTRNSSSIREPIQEAGD